MKQLLVVYHSQSGRTAHLAAAVAEGASLESGVSVQLHRAMEAGTAEWLASDAIVFCSPENLGYLSGGMKDALFLEYPPGCFYPVQARQGMPYVQLVCAGNDGTGAVRQLERILTGCRMRKVAEPLIVRGQPDNQALQAGRDLGQAVAAGLMLGIF